MDQKNKITNYHPRPALKNPIILFKQMKNDLFLSKELAWRLFIRNISAMYRQTYLGYFWAFLPPIANTLIWVFLNSNNIVDVGESSIPYPVFVMIGTLHYLTRQHDQQIAIYYPCYVFLSLLLPKEVCL